MQLTPHQQLFTLASKINQTRRRIASFQTQIEPDEINQIVLDRFLESRLQGPEAPFEVGDIERGGGSADTAGVLLDRAQNLVPGLTASLASLAAELTRSAY